MSQDEGSDGVGYRVTRVVYRPEFVGTHLSQSAEKRRRSTSTRVEPVASEKATMDRRQLQMKIE